MKTVISLLMIPLICLWILMIIDSFSNAQFFCTFFGWHKAPKEQGFDGCSPEGTCSRCGEHVLQDSQGNWF